MVYYDGIFYVKIGHIKGDVTEPAAVAGWIQASVLGWPGLDVGKGLATGDYFLKKFENQQVLFRCRFGSHSGAIVSFMKQNRARGVTAEIRFVRGFVPVRITLEDVLVVGWHTLTTGDEEVTLDVVRATTIP